MLFSNLVIVLSHCLGNIQPPSLMSAPIDGKNPDLEGVALACLDALNNAIAYDSYKPRPSKSVPSSYVNQLGRNLLNGICGWICHFLDQDIAYYYDQSETYALLCSSLVCRLFSQPSWRDSVTQYPGFLTKFSRMIIRVLDPTRNYSDQPKDWVSKAFVYLVETQSSWKSYVFKVFEENPSKTALVLLHPFMRVIENGARKRDKNFQLVDALDSLSLHSKMFYNCCVFLPSIKSLLVKHDGVRWVSKFLSRLLVQTFALYKSQDESITEPQLNLVLIIYISSMGFVTSSVETFGTPILQQSLHHHFLATACKWYSFLAARLPSPPPSLSPSLLELYPKAAEVFIEYHNQLMVYSTHLEIIRMLPWALESLDKDTHFQNMLKPGPCYTEELTLTMQKFLKVIDLRVKDKEDLDAFYKMRKVWCHNPQCPNISKQLSNTKKAIHTRSCSGCDGLARYCSKSCQRQDWKEGDHRQECKELALASAEFQRGNEHQYTEFGELTSQKKIEMIKHYQNYVIGNEVKRQSRQIYTLFKDVYAKHEPRKHLFGISKSMPILELDFRIPSGVECHRTTWGRIECEASDNMSATLMGDILDPTKIVVFARFPCGSSHSLTMLQAYGLPGKD
ncbi:hypothetical protein VKT23_004801 [Stygiomarasmius scandens]|uniref:MYND-type domain-containing protein n=1 Tax=Marasmiellus scandens TaxID=2682957 RepID=A0ABR1JS56_9AGAR